MMISVKCDGLENAKLVSKIDLNEILKEEVEADREATKEEVAEAMAEMANDLEYYTRLSKQQERKIKSLYIQNDRLKVGMDKATEVLVIKELMLRELSKYVICDYCPLVDCEFVGHYHTRTVQLKETCLTYMLQEFESIAKKIIEEAENISQEGIQAPESGVE